MRTVPSFCPARAALSGAGHRRPPFGWTAIVAGWLRPQPRRVLDVRTLSDHLKRDMGLLDGNDPRGPRP